MKDDDKTLVENSENQQAEETKNISSDNKEQTNNVTDEDKTLIESQDERSRLNERSRIEDERTTDPNTGKIISKRAAMLAGGGILLTAAGVGIGNLTAGTEKPEEILLDTDNDNVADTVLTDQNQDGIYNTETEVIHDETTTEPETVHDDTNNAGQRWDPHTAPVASEGTVTDDMSFSEAFAAARAELGPGGLFVWQGHHYGTFYGSELDDNHLPIVDYETVEPHEYPLFHADDNNSSVADETNDDTHSDEEVVDDDSDNTNTHTVSNDTNTEDDISDDEINVIGLDSNMDNQVDAVFVDINQDGSADVMQTDLNGDGQITEDEIQVIHDPSTLIDPETPVSDDQMTVDLNGDGQDDMIIVDVDNDQVGDVIGIDENQDAEISDDEVTVLNPDAIETDDSNTTTVVYDGEVAEDMPDDVPDSELDTHNDDLAALDDNFDDYNDWA